MLMKEEMADSSAAGKVRGSKGRNDRSKATVTKVKASADSITFGRAESDKIESRQKGKHESEDQELKEIPAGVMAKWKEEFKIHSRVKCPSSGCWLEFPSIYGLKCHYQRCQSGVGSKKYNHQCLLCEASFVSKSQLEKHKQWKHEDKRTQATEVDEKVTKAVGRGRGRKRVTENAETSPKKSKQQKRELSKHSENGECATQNRDNKLTNTTEAQGTLTSNELSKGKKQISFPEEDPERTKHRRKQKTPKKFTGEQPSISGTFGLKGKPTPQSGLSKPDDKGRGRGKKKNNITSTEELQRKPLGVHIKKEAVTYLPGSQEEKWHQEITEKGEVVCPNCMTVHRKTVTGLRKHLEICKELQDALKCQHCAKQFKSKAGLKYHTMAEHNNKPVMNAEKLLDEQQERERLRRVLKQMGKLKCPNEGCTATFASLMGYQYHLKRCGKEPADIEKAVFICEHCGKEYKSKAGHDYHVKSEHTMATEDSDQKSAEEDFENLFEKTPSGRIRRRSAQVAVFHLQEIAEDELSKLWTRRRNKDDLVPDIKRLKYTRPGLPSFNPKQLESWKNEVKENGQICCPNNHCEAIYSSFSGLKAHLATCTKGEHLVGKYRCLICQKEFSSESGVKYHINNSHSENWFRASAEKPARNKRELKVTKSERKKNTTGKKRGRKPKERTSELSIKDKEVAGTKTADQITTQCPADLKRNSKIKRKNILPSSKKGGSG
ncbi:zinc finger protein 512B isoform X1 [Carcharodon carcharias]|uniref:zinc finger protein 512B isoform X1 n=2 Tax=Carcharodon carcharias TaxID=13397 RepID=UPI001B7ECC2C|nr:zinc finger protein 512B isoform X1 [Carcharodon carcharias]